MKSPILAIHRLKPPPLGRRFTFLITSVISVSVFCGLLWATSSTWLAAAARLRGPTSAPVLNRHPFESSPPQKCSKTDKLWDEAQEKFKDLRNDKFTIALQTYDRAELLESTLHGLLVDKIPSLHEVVIVWNNLEETPPKDYVSEHGVRVRFRASGVNSLNQKLLPDPAFETQAILLSDDDVYFKPTDLEFAFHAWREFGQQKLVGGLPRCAVTYGDKWQYDFCTKDGEDDTYSLIITNLAFWHISFMDYYSSKDPTMTKIRAYVDDHMNCEDIAANFMTSMLTQKGPLLVAGHEGWVNKLPSKGISTKKGHIEARHQCVNDFVKIFGCMPLREESGRLQRGTLSL